MKNNAFHQLGKCINLPVWAEYASRNGKLPSERPPWLGGELGRLPISSSSTESASANASGVHLVLLGPDGIAIPIRPFRLEEPAVVVPVSGLAPGHGLLGAHDGEPPLHPGRGGARRRGQRERGPGCPGVSCADDVLELRVLVRLLTPRADGAGVLDCVREALGADLEVALAGEYVVAALVAHDLAVAAVDGAGGSFRPGHLRVAGLGVDDLVHEVRARDAVEAAREEGVGDVLLLDARGDGRVHGLVVGRGRDVDVVAGELVRLRLVVERHVVAAGAQLAVEVVAGVADVAAGVGAAGEGDHGTVGPAGGLRAGVVAAPAAGVGHPTQAAAVAVAQPPAAAVGGHGGRSGDGCSSYGSVSGGG